jgi:hypothetical protein
MSIGSEEKPFLRIEATEPPPEEPSRRRIMGMRY